VAISHHMNMKQPNYLFFQNNMMDTVCKKEQILQSAGYFEQIKKLKEMCFKSVRNKEFKQVCLRMVICSKATRC